MLNPDGLPSNGKLASRAIATRDVPIGELSEFPIGTVQLSGKIVRQAVDSVLPKAELLSIDVNVSKEDIMVFRRGEVGADHDDLIMPATRYGIPNDAEYQDALCLGFMYGGDPCGVILPAVESYRFFYCRSSKLANAFVDGLFHDPTAHIYSSFDLDEASGEATIGLRRDMIIDDAKYIALFATEPAKSMAMDVSSYLSLQQRAKVRHLRALPPMGGKVTLKGWFLNLVAHDGVVRKVLVRVQSCTWPLPFRSIRCFHELQHEYKEVGGTELGQGGSGPPIDEDKSTEARTKKTDGNDATPKYPPRDVESFKDEDPFPLLSKVELTTVVDVVGRRKGRKGRATLVSSGLGSTVSGQGSIGVRRYVLGSHDQPRQRVLRSRAPIVLAQTLDKVVAAVKEMAGMPGVVIAYRAVAGEYDEDDSGLILNVFPVSSNRALRKSIFLNPPMNTVRRRMLVAEICLGGRYRYLLDAERRIDTDGHDIETRSLLIVWNALEMPIEDHDLERAYQERVMAWTSSHFKIFLDPLKTGFVAHRWTKTSPGARLLERIFTVEPSREEPE